MGVGYFDNGFYTEYGVGGLFAGEDKYPPPGLSTLLHIHAHGQRAFPPRRATISPSCPLLRFAPLSREAPTAPTGRHDYDSLSRVHGGGVFPPEVYDSFFFFFFVLFALFSHQDVVISCTRVRSPSLADPQVHSAGPVFPAGEPVRVKDATFAEDADLDGDAELDVADDALASVMLAVAAAVGAEAEFAQHHWIPSLEDFGVGDAGVGHVRVHAAGAMPGGACPGSAGDGFVVAEAFGDRGRGEIAAEAEREVVAVALGGGAGFEAAEDDVRYALALLWEF